MSIENLLPWIVWVLIIVYPIIEGIREYYFYGINRSANFSQRAKDSDRKTMNVLTWILGHGLAAIYLSDYNWLIAALSFVALAFWRWIALDGVFNVKRSLGFFYAGNSGRSFTDNLLYPLSIPARAILKLLPLILTLLLIYFLR
jgi:hypothetical protein